MFLLSNLPKTVLKKKTRLGMGPGSGNGKNAGMGHKGQKKRGKIRVGFEGGQIPLSSRLPKLRGFNRPQSSKKKLSVTLSHILLESIFDKAEKITFDLLVEKN